MRVLNYTEAIKSGDLKLDTMLYALNKLKYFGEKDKHFYDAESVFQNVFWSVYELFILEDDGYKGCLVTRMCISTSGERYVDVICCIGTFKGKFEEYITAFLQKVKEKYAADKPAFYKINGRVGWSGYFKNLGMHEMSRAYAGSFHYGD